MQFSKENIMKTKLVFMIVLLATIVANAFSDQQMQLERARDRFNNEIVLQRVAATGGVATMSIPNLSTQLYGLNAISLNEQSVIDLGASVISDYSQILRLSPGDFRVRRIENAGGKWYLSYTQVYNDIPVWRSELGWTIETNGNIHTIGGSTFPEISIESLQPSIVRLSAGDLAIREFLKNHPGPAALKGDAELALYPEVSSDQALYHLVWIVSVTSASPRAEMLYLVDSHTGSIRFRENQIVHGGGDEMANVTVNVKRQYWPQHHYDPPSTAVNFPGVYVRLYNYIGQQVGQGYTNANGDFTVSGISYTYYYANIDRNFANSWVRIQQGIADITPLFLPPSISRTQLTDESNVYQHATVMHDYFTGAPFNYSAMNYQALAFVNDGSGSNGWSDGTNIGFGSEAGQYWARAADVVDHEYTHCVVFHIYGGWITGHDQSFAMNEGFPDYFACVVTGDELLGESVAAPGYNLPRDLGNVLTMDDWLSLTPHQRGQIIAGACWDLRQVLSTTDLLVFRALQRTPRANNFPAYANNVVYEDDDDGNPNNGTPNLETIRSKFYAKKIYFTAGPPRVPQNLAGSLHTDQYGYRYPRLTWNAAPEPDVISGGNILVHRRYKSGLVYPPQWGSWSVVATLSGTSTEYIDWSIPTAGSGNDSVQYRIQAKDNIANLSAFSSIVSFQVSSDMWKPVGGDPGSLAQTPVTFNMDEAYPNPFNPSTLVKYQLPQDGFVTLKVFDVLGREVATLVDEAVAAGYHSTTFDAAQLSSGVYFTRLTVNNELGRQVFAKTSKLLLVR